MTRGGSQKNFVQENFVRRPCSTNQKVVQGNSPLHFVHFNGVVCSDGTWTGPESDPGKGLDGTLRDSNRRLGLSDQYDWTTGVLDNGYEWRKFRVVPCLHPLRPPLSFTSFTGGRNRSAFGLPWGGQGSFPLYGGPFARSYSVSIYGPKISCAYVFFLPPLFCQRIPAFWPQTLG